ncbi:hypothetical protein KAF25_010431 [Fusarium avenaceum]|uniref:Major facilitator superfamily (MFS) profile domain-containing protein n=1 Tax=Fusarium avenaceum TaxID=40199 RepID=A0A9P7GSM3_9HYPO|nr:hypothetical protein KAF25_010431 [Fusarium avenaceum]
MSSPISTAKRQEGVCVESERSLDSSLSENDVQFLENFSPQAQAKTWRKVDFMIMPTLSILYLIGHIDRANIGNAKIEGLEASLGMTGGDYNVVLSIFFIPYILAEIPSNYILYKLKRPSRFLAFLVISWGIVITCTGVVQSYGGLLACRFLLGLFEAGFFPGAMHYITLWYPPNKTQTRTAIFYSTAAVSGAFSGLLAAAISEMRGLGGYEGWRWIFIVEGLVSVILGICGFFLLPDTPSLSTKKLAADEIRFLELTHISTRGKPTSEGPKMTLGQRWSIIWLILMDFQIYLQALSLMANVVPAYGLKFTLPQIMKNMGYTSRNAQLLSAPPYILGAISALVFGHLGDRLKWRAPVIAIGQGLLIISYSIQIVYAGHIQDHIALCYFAVFLATAGIYPIAPGVNAWTVNNLAGQMRRAIGIAFMLTMCNLGGIVGSFMFIDSDKPKYPTGFGSSLAFSASGLLSTALLFVSYWYINRRRSRLSPVEVRGKFSEEDLGRLGDKSPLFRYHL